MYNYQYVTKQEATPVRECLLEIIHKVQNIVRDKFTFQYQFIGSSSRNMITYDPSSNVGYDFDVNLQINDDEGEYSEKEIKHLLMNAFNQIVRKYGYSFCEDSTRVFTVKFIDYQNATILHSCDFAIVNDWVDDYDKWHQEYIRFNKKQGSYYWEQSSSPYLLEEKASWLRKNGAWNDVRAAYLNKKNRNINHVKKSRSLYAEAIHEMCQLYGYFAE